MKRAFTVLELLVMIAVLLVLTGLLLPGASRARHLAGMTKCQSNLRQHGIAMAVYTAEYGAFPVAAGSLWLLAGAGENAAAIVMCPNSAGSSYVHNRWGSGRSHVADHLGLGPRGSSGTAVSAVMSPAECILHFDAIPVLAPPYRRPGMLPGNTRDPASVRLHNDDGNMGFVDGHVENVAVQVFARGDAAIRDKWNIDNQAHDENWP